LRIHIYNQGMRKLIYVLLFCCWSQVQAQGLSQSGYQGRPIEVTYDDLVQELSQKKQAITQKSTEFMGFNRVHGIFGYSFSSMNLDLPTGANSFALNGIDVRINGKFLNSTWQAEGGLKNYAKITSGNKSAEARIFTAALKNQNYLNANLQYVVGVASSAHWINTRDRIRSQNEVDLSVNVTAGLRGPLSSQLSWGFDLNAYSPVSGRLLRGGIEGTILLSSLL
jgi:hypothetical protein